MVKILAISDDTRGVTIKPCRTLDTSSKPIAMNGDFVAMCDHDSETLILNWKTEEQALLKSPDTWQVTRLIHTLLVIMHSTMRRTNHFMSFLPVETSSL